MQVLIFSNVMREFMLNIFIYLIKINEEKIILSYLIYIYILSSFIFMAITMSVLIIFIAGFQW